MLGGGAPRERGRPARMLSRCVPLSFPAMRYPATLPVDPDGGNGRGAASVVRAGRPRSRGASSHDVVAAKEVHRSLCLFVVRLQQ